MEEIAAKERIMREELAANERRAQRQAELIRYRIAEENKTLRLLAAAAVATIGLVAIVYLAGYYYVENNVVYKSIVAIVGFVVLGVDLKLILDWLFPKHSLKKID